MFRWILAPWIALALSTNTAWSGDAAPTATGGAVCNDADLKAEVPALSDFHEVIAPLWHEAWPNKDLARMRELLPEIDGHIATLQKTDLPGILRDKKPAWDRGVAACAAQAAALRQALDRKQEQAALDAAESLHASFEGLVRTIRPRMAELDAYHQVLYRVYHFDHPNKDLAALTLHSEEMAAKCAALAGAPIPKRYEAKAGQLKAEFAALCTATGDLKTACAGKDAAALDAAVEKVHTTYRACEQMFE
jgi:hypothetical protein